MAAALPLDPVAAELVADGLSNGIWLIELNKWRETAGLSAVGENERLSRGSEQHARYLVQEGPPEADGFYVYARAIGAAGHAEDSARPSFTQEGAEAAGGGRRTFDVMQAATISFSNSERNDIRELLIGPFHRFSLLAPWAQIAGYGAFGSAPRRAAALALRGRVNRDNMTKAILFPPDGSTFEYGRMFELEWPDPLSACPGYQIPVGLPISVQTGTPLQVKTASITDSTTGRAVESCTIDAFNYTNSDPVTQTRGRDVLRSTGAVIIIPRRPLNPGDHYAVSIQTLKHDFNWNFAVAPGSRKTTSVASSTRHKPARRRAAPLPLPEGTSRVW